MLKVTRQFAVHFGIFRCEAFDLLDGLLSLDQRALVRNSRSRCAQLFLSIRKLHFKNLILGLERSDFLVEGGPHGGADDGGGTGGGQGGLLKAFASIVAT